MKIYTGQEIRAMRNYLKESRSKFADRFFLTFEAVKGWESGRRNVSGPALIILGQINELINNKKAESARLLSEYRRGLK